MDCKECKARWRADKLIDNAIEAGASEPEGYAGDKTETKNLDAMVKEMGIKCPDCGKINFSEIKKFNLMLKTFL
jgi:glycyl-tRNA synthetase